MNEQSIKFSKLFSFQSVSNYQIHYPSQNTRYRRNRYNFTIHVGVVITHNAKPMATLSPSFYLTLSIDKAI